MLPATTNLIGSGFGFPDVCNTPTPAGPIPTPYPNISVTTTSLLNASTVFTSFAQQSTLLTQVPMTNGDEAGTATGLTSGTVMGPQRFNKGSFTVVVEGTSAVQLTSLTGHNGAGTSNAPLGAQIVPSSIDVLLGF